VARGWWYRSPATTGINNLLVLIAFYLFAASGARTWLGQKMRHPQLTGVKTWALAHLLVNGDLPSFILFGGLLAWAVVEVILINRQNHLDPTRDRRDQPRQGSGRRDRDAGPLRHHRMAARLVRLPGLRLR
jgi:uncharacterized membrane protein